jgi:DNA-binding transcriptional MerR regulator
MTELFTIGQLARRTGLPVRTIRFWSDIDVLPPSGRSGGGYRLYDAEAVARLDLVRTLRELGLDLDTVQKVLRRQVSVADVAAAHAAALDAQIRTLKVRRAVLRSIASRGSAAEEMTMVHRLARLSAQERQRIVDEFVDGTFADLPADRPGFAQAMRQMPAELPDDPTPEQVDAWVELAELIADPDFRRRTREMAEAGAAPATGGPAVDPARVSALAGAALADGVAPESAQGQAVVAELVGGASRDERLAVADALATFSDRRVERYWQLLGVINGWPPGPPQVPAFEWLIEALRA